MTNMEQPGRRPALPPASAFVNITVRFHGEMPQVARGDN